MQSPRQPRSSNVESMMARHENLPPRAPFPRDQFFLIGTDRIEICFIDEKRNEVRWEAVIIAEAGYVPKNCQKLKKCEFEIS